MSYADILKYKNKNPIWESASVELQDDDYEVLIDVKNRNFIFPENFSYNIGVLNDHKTEAITFICSRFIEGIDLLTCTHFLIKWENTTAGSEGYYLSEPSLWNKGTKKDIIQFSWILSNDATAATGTINFSISIIRFGSNLIQSTQNTNENILTKINKYNIIDNKEIYIKKVVEKIETTEEIAYTFDDEENNTYFLSHMTKDSDFTEINDTYTPILLKPFGDTTNDINNIIEVYSIQRNSEKFLILNNKEYTYNNATDIIISGKKYNIINATVSAYRSVNEGATDNLNVKAIIFMEYKDSKPTNNYIIGKAITISGSSIRYEYEISGNTYSTNTLTDSINIDGIQYNVLTGGFTKKVEQYKNSTNKKTITSYIVESDSKEYINYNPEDGIVKVIKQKKEYESKFYSTCITDNTKSSNSPTTTIKTETRYYYSTGNADNYDTGTIGIFWGDDVNKKFTSQVNNGNYKSLESYDAELLSESDNDLEFRWNTQINSDCYIQDTLYNNNIDLISAAGEDNSRLAFINIESLQESIRSILS